MMEITCGFCGEMLRHAQGDSRLLTIFLVSGKWFSNLLDCQAPCLSLAMTT